MHLLLIHQNFPAQFRELAPAWLAAGHQITAIGCRSTAPPGEEWASLRYWSYRSRDHRDPQTLTPLERIAALDQLCTHLSQQGLEPDLVMAHSAWGEALPLRRLFPRTPLVVYPELWGSPSALGIGFDAHLPTHVTAAMLRRIDKQNLLAELAISQADAAVVPCISQLESFPFALRPKLRLIFEGVPLHRPPVEEELPPDLADLPGDAPLVTLVSRELEPLRGLRQALLAWPEVAREHPTAQLVLVGDREGGYGEESPQGPSHLDACLEVLPEAVDRRRIHITGRLSHVRMLALLRRSSCHLGLSYPYTLSWSLVEAMSLGAAVVSNVGGPLAAEVEEGIQALLVPFNDAQALAQAILQLLNSAKRRQILGQAAQQWVADRFSLSKSLEGYDALFAELTAGDPRPPAAAATGDANRHAAAAATTAGWDTRK